MFIYEKAPFPKCHASTLLAIPDGRYLAAWFGGKDEGAKDVQIWASKFDGKTWSTPIVVGSEPGYPTWNPVYFRTAQGRIGLWYKAGPKPDNWTGYVRWSDDLGQTWSPPEMLPAGFYGPVRAKPITLKNGTILAGTSVETHKNWTPYVDRSTDGGKNWTRSNPFHVPGQFGQIQPTIVETSPDRVVSLMRSRAPKLICRSVSVDGGRTFSPAEPLKEMPNPSAGIDAVMLPSGMYLIHNPTVIARSPITVSKSTDEGKTFAKVIDLETEPGEYSYPAMVGVGENHLGITFTWRRTHIKFVVLDVTSGKLAVS